MADLTALSAGEIAGAVSTGAVTARAVAEAHLARIHAVDPGLGAFLLVTDDLALEMADAVDAGRRAGATPGALAGVPVALKDILSTRGVRTTCGSRVLEPWVPPFDATVVERLRGAGAVFVGKTNLDEFAMGSSTENSAFHVTRNPWDRARTPGGSSGGSAVAVAARMAPVAIGTDTGGSIRQPAALTGVTGLKPTYGRVSRWGLVAFASSLDQAGPFARSAADCARVLAVIGGHDPRDSTSAATPQPDYGAGLGRDLSGIRLGVPREYFVDGMEPEVERAVRAAIATLEGLGAVVRAVTLPHTEYALAVYYLIASAEASANLSRFDGVRYGLRAAGATHEEMVRRTRSAGFGREVQRRILLGTYALSAGYHEQFHDKAQRVRTLVCRDFDAAFHDVDALVSPTSPTVAFALGARVDDPVAMYLGDVLTLPASLAGLPAISVPCGLGEGGLPVGLQITGSAFDEATVLRIADAFERATAALRGTPPEAP